MKRQGSSLISSAKAPKKAKTKANEKTIEELRPKVQNLLRKAIGDDSVSASVEKHVFLACKSFQKYRERCRILVSNLRTNASLKSKLQSGDLDPELFAGMTEGELATKELQKIRKEHADSNKKAAVAPVSGAMIPTSEYACPSCERFECEYMLVASRRYFAKCETWGRKDGEQDTFRVRCLSCAHEWTRIV